MDIYKGPWPYQISDRSVPASVRLRNIGAIGASRDGHENRFGALPPTILPASDGSQLPTPAFDSIYGGAAYWGHYVVRCATVNDSQTSIDHILAAYSTGNANQYAEAVAQDTGIEKYKIIDIWRDEYGYKRLYDIMMAMGRWEAGARSKYGPGYDAFSIQYDQNDPKVVNELYWGMVHGMREGWRDAGFMIEVTPQELTYQEPKKQLGLWARILRGLKSGEAV